MKERPILFNEKNVRAILEDRKTQTRRPCKFTSGGHLREPGGHRRWHPEDPDAALASPFGVPGDRLWVRETWGLLNPVFEFYDCSLAGIIEADLPDGRFTVYRAGHIDGDSGDGPGPPVWRSSIHMPRWASRIDLSVKRVWVERLRDITAHDVLCEGVRVPMSPNGGALLSVTDRVDSHPLWQDTESATEADWLTGYFALSWNQIYAKKGYGWDKTPWVWCCEFERIEE